MKQEYKRTILCITHFDCEDVITTSEIDKNNAYVELGDLDFSGIAPPREF